MNEGKNEWTMNEGKNEWTTDEGKNEWIRESTVLLGWEMSRTVRVMTL